MKYFTVSFFIYFYSFFVVVVDVFIFGFLLFSFLYFFCRPLSKSTFYTGDKIYSCCMV